jgi:hypothetical protein
MSDGEEVPLPDVHEALLDASTERALLTDIEALTELLGVTLKGAPTEMVTERPLSLAEALGAWRAGLARGMQLRYRHDGVEWWDTLLRTPAGTRLVRIAQRFTTGA